MAGPKLLPPFAWYVRKSDNKSDLERQRISIRAWLSAESVTIPEQRQYTDTGSRDLIHKRPEFRRLLKDAAAGAFRTLVVVCLDRFGVEDAWDCIARINELQKAGVQLFSLDPDEGLLTTKDEGTLMKLIFRAQASREEQVKKGSRAIEGKHAKLAQGASFMGGPVPYGYDKECRDPAGNLLWLIHTQGRERRTNPETGQAEHITLRLMVGPDGVERRCDGDKSTHPVKRRNDVIRLVPSRDPERIKVVKLIFSLWVGQDLSILSICKKLNAAGYRHYTELWSPTAVRGILANPAYYGASVYNRQKAGRFAAYEKGEQVRHPEKDKFKRYFRSADKWVTKENAHTALIGRPDWDRAQAKLDKLKGSPTRPARRPDLWLRRFCWCAHCGRPLMSRRAGGIQYLFCGTRKREVSKGGKPSCPFNMVRYSEVESFVADHFGALLTELSGMDTRAVVEVLRQHQERVAGLWVWDDELLGVIVAAVREVNGIELQLDRRGGRAWPDLEAWNKLPGVRETIEVTVATWERTIEERVAELTAQHERLTLRWAEASAEQAPVLQRRCLAIEAERAALKKKRLSDAVLNADQLLREARAFMDNVGQVVAAEGGPAQAEALGRVVSRLVVRWREKRGPRAKSKLQEIQVEYVDGHDGYATGC